MREKYLQDLHEVYPLNSSAPQARKKTILLALCLGYFLVILDITIVNVALPDIQIKFNTTISGLQWIVAGYSLVFASCLLTAGMLSDRLGGRKIFLTGLTFFVLASILCGLAPTLLALQLFRLLQGLGAALMVPASLALLSHAYPQPAERARAIGIWGTIAGIAAVTGPVLGGLLIHLFGWRSIFLLNIPVGVLGFILTLLYIPRSPQTRQNELDLPAQILAVLGLSALTFALIEGPERGWGEPVILGAFGIFVATAILFLIRERYARKPMLPLSLFRLPTFWAGNMIGLFLNFGFYGQLFLINLFFSHVQGLSPLLTGLALLPESGVVLLVSAFSGRLTSRIGARIPMLLGLAIGTLGFFGLSLIQAQTSYLLLGIPLLAIGFGTAFTMPAMTVAVISSTPDHHAGIASGVLNTSRQIGQVLGTALLGSFVAVQNSFLSGMHLAMLIAAALFLLGCLFSARYISSSHEAKKDLSL